MIKPESEMTSLANGTLLTLVNVNGTEMLVLNISQTDLATQSDLDNLQDVLESGMYIVWLTLHVINIFSMQIGFALLEAGSLHKKHQKSILMKNLMDGCFGAVGWFLLGNRIYIGNYNYIHSSDGLADFFLAYAFAITTATIVSGSIAARMKLYVYIILTFCLTSLAYPLIAHSVWMSGGFLSNDFVDFAGGVVVHGFGGSVGLVAAKMCGPRFGRFTSEPDSIPGSKGPRIRNGVIEMHASSASLQTIGALMLWVGWFSFNGVSSQGVDSEALELSLRACINTLLASSVAATVGLLYLRFRDGFYDLAESLNCLLAGLVAITSGCAFVDTFAACLIGGLAGFVYVAGSGFILYKLRIDDPLNASALHGFCGTFGGICTGIFHMERGLISGEVMFFFTQLGATIGIVVYGFLFTYIILSIVRWLKGDLSCSEEDQILGLDFKYHDGRIITDLTSQQVAEYNQTKAAYKKVQAKNNSEKGASMESVLRSSCT